LSRRQPRAAASEELAWRVVLCAPTPLAPHASQLAQALVAGGAEVEVAREPGGDADVVIWTDPTARSAPMPVNCLNVVDLHGWRGTGVLEHCWGAELLLAGSEVEYGAWSAAVEGAGLDVPIAVVPFAAAPGQAPAATGFKTLLIVAGAEPDTAALERAAAWARARGMEVGVLDADGPAGLLALSLAGPPPSAESAAVLDLRPAREVARVLAPDALVTALAAGAPVLCYTETPLLRRVEAEGAGLALPDLEAGLDALAALPPERFQALSEAAIALARREFDPDRAAAALTGALGRALARRRRRDAAWLTPLPEIGPGGHVLAISDEALNLVDLRVHLPLEAMHRRGLIDGYSVLRHGELAFSTGAGGPEQRIDMLWVHRSVEPGVQLLMRALGQPFVYDVDDNLLVSPSYREAFPAETMEVAHGLLRGCAVLSCATPRLLQLLQRHSGIRLAAKAVITPNLASGPPAHPQPGPPKAVVWASSDRPALTASRREIERAVRDFCLAHKLKVVCLGAKPPAILADSAMEIEHVGLQSYRAYLSRLRTLAPGILVCPLESGDAGRTQDFVDGKSDVKAIEARLAGLVGVFSRARPYVESDLAPEILCENTYEAWLEGLARAARSCAAPEPVAPWPAHRNADAAGSAPWVQALARARLAEPITLAAVLGAVRYVREQQETALTTREAFDEEYYLGQHDDVRDAVESGVVRSGYDHYRNSGLREGRAARRRPGSAVGSELWWHRLLQTVSRLETDVQDRAEALQALRARVRLGRAPARPPALSTPDTAPAPSNEHLVWRPKDAAVDQPCPVCDTPGPHPVLLRADGHALAQCRSCASCFYENRVYYDYEGEQLADTLLQLYLEQNGGIHHQTRFLFAMEGVRSVLDVGCGFGYGVDLATKVLGWRATGIDPSFYAREGARLLQADIRKEYLTEATELGEPYELVIASEVIEHMPDPYAFLGLLRRWLHRAGTLVLTTPNAAALAPGLEPSALGGILSLNVHLILFNKDSLGAALRRAGFKHVQVEEQNYGLIAYASQAPLRFDPEAEQRHFHGYKSYLEYLVETADPGGALWNGAAGRLLTLLQERGDLSELQALFARTASAWRERFGIDLARLRLPGLMAESAFTGEHRVRSAALTAQQPINLAVVLLARAVMERRTPGRTPEQVLAYARPAYLHAIQTRRVLDADGIFDLQLKWTAWQARRLIVDCLAELAPEVEPELLQMLATKSPGRLHDWIDLPQDAVVERLVPAFTALVHADRFDAAERLAPWLRDLDAICAATQAKAEARFRALFTAGVLRLVHENDPAAALEAFERMEAEARHMLDDRDHAETARHFLGVATEHVRLAAGRLAA